MFRSTFTPARLFSGSTTPYFGRLSPFLPRLLYELSPNQPPPPRQKSQHGEGEHGRTEHGQRDDCWLGGLGGNRVSGSPEKTSYTAEFSGRGWPSLLGRPAPYQRSPV